MKKSKLEVAIRINEKMPEGFAKEFFRLHPQVMLDLIPDNIDELFNNKPLRKSQKHKQKKLDKVKK